MRLRVHIATANEELVALVNEGYDALSVVQADYQQRKKQGTYDDSKDVGGIAEPVTAWEHNVEPISKPVESTEWHMPDAGSLGTAW